MAGQGLTSPEQRLADTLKQMDLLEEERVLLLATVRKGMRELREAERHLLSLQPLSAFLHTERHHPRPHR